MSGSQSPRCCNDSHTYSLYYLFKRVYSCYIMVGITFESVEIHSVQEVSLGCIFRMSDKLIYGCFYFILLLVYHTCGTLLSS